MCLAKIEALLGGGGFSQNRGSVRGLAKIGAL